MSQLLYNHLREKAELNPDLSVLLAQWEFDRRIIANALRAVAQNFPHYSLHDHTHSNTILVQIERILGADKLKTLSATDTWLILEAAYLHDIGMVISDDNLKLKWQSQEMKLFLKSKAEDPTDELHSLAQFLLNPKNEDFTKNDSWPIEFRRSFTMLVAEFFRPTHHKLSKEIIENPVETIRLKSPRNELIPSRLFGVLGDICSSHGESFEFILSLPKRSSGLSNETANPRFVASLLRIGDLLDLDNNRFCPALLSTFGDLPEHSLAHYHKHLAIKHMFVDSKTVEVSAETDNYETYDIVRNWFDWIQSELKDQASKWTEITPETISSSLPTSAILVNRLKDYLLLDSNSRPTLEIDREKAIQLFSSMNLYKDSRTYIREILQNAIDSTTLRAWLEFERENKLRKQMEEMSYLSWQNYLSKQASNFQISVDVSSKKSEVENQKTEIHIRITDKGLGIDLDDLKAMSTIMGSARNRKKNDLIARMPQWAWPTGIFGVGLQSLFHVTEKITFETKSIFTGNAYQIELHKPQGRRGGNILIKQSNGAELDFGASVSFTILADRIPQRYSVSYSDERALDTISGFDPIADEAFDLERSQIESSAATYSEFSRFPVFINGDRASRVIEGTGEDEGWFFDSDTCMEIFVRPTFESNSVRFFYRGQLVKNATFRRYHCIDLIVNVHHGRANQWLTIDRSDVIPERRQELGDLVSKTVKNQASKIANFFEEKSETANDSEFKRQRNMFHLYLHLFHASANLAKQEFWESVLLDAKNSISVKDLLATEAVELIVSDTGNRIIEATRDQSSLKLKISAHSGFLSPVLMLIRQKFPYLSITNYTQTILEGIANQRIEMQVSTYTSKPNAYFEISPRVLQLYLANLAHRRADRGSFSRHYVPIFNEKYSVLLVKELPPFLFSIWDICGTVFPDSFLILPFFFAGDSIRVKDLNKLINFVSMNSLNGKLKKATVRSLYEDLIEEIDELMKTSDDWAIKRKKRISDQEED